MAKQCQRKHVSQVPKVRSAFPVSTLGAREAFENRKISYQLDITSLCMKFGSCANDRANASVYVIRCTPTPHATWHGMRTEALEQRTLCRGYELRGGAGFLDIGGLDALGLRITNSARALKRELQRQRAQRHVEINIVEVMIFRRGPSLSPTPAAGP